MLEIIFLHQKKPTIKTASIMAAVMQYELTSLLFFGQIAGVADLSEFKPSQKSRIIRTLLGLLPDAKSKAI